jgi:hypothetical protein
MTGAPTRVLRDEALSLLDRHGSILELAREISRLMRRQGIPGVVVGGIAVVLHGHLRVTKDVDVFLDQPLQPIADLIAMKLASGMRNMLRAQDLADVIGLIRHNCLTSEYANHLDKSLRPAFRKLVKAIQQEGGC